MKKLLQIDFEFKGPFGDEMTSALKDLAESINNEPGVIWKIWTENKQDQRAGGVYLFEDEQSANAYLKMHSQRLQGMGVNDIRAQIFDVNMPLSNINNALV